MSGPRPLPAVLQASTSAETAYGGADETWAAVATLWVSMTIAPPNQALDGAEASPAEADQAYAVARDHPLATAGQRLLVGDDADAWRVLRVDRGAPGAGRMTLRLDRLI